MILDEMSTQVLHNTGLALVGYLSNLQFFFCDFFNSCSNEETLYTHGNFGTTYIHPYNQSRVLEQSTEESAAAKTKYTGTGSEKKFILRMQNARSRRLGMKKSLTESTTSSPVK